MSLSFGSSFVTKFIYFYFQMKCLLLDEKWKKGRGKYWHFVTSFCSFNFRFVPAFL
jgi:hypothetical protein